MCTCVCVCARELRGREGANGGGGGEGEGINVTHPQMAQQATFAIQAEVAASSATIRR